MSNNVYILGGCRTANGELDGQFRMIPILELVKPVLQTAVDRSGVPATELNEIVIGNVLHAGHTINLAKQAANFAELPIDVPAYTISGSALKAVQVAYTSIKAGEATMILAAGVESMSNSEHAEIVRADRRNVENKDASSGSGSPPGGNGGAANGGGGGEDTPDSVIHKTLMGLTSEEAAAKYGVSRVDQDKFALESQKKARVAIIEHHFDLEIRGVECPISARNINKDEPPRPEVTLKELCDMSPCFKSDGTITLGNSAGCCDGASAVILGHSSVVSMNKLRPMARILAFAEVAIDAMVTSSSPIHAIRKLLERVHWGIHDVDLYELHEPFAAQAVAVVRELGLDKSKVNVSGGAIALGHPIGASGTRILVTLMYGLRRLGLKRGVCAIGLGSGMAIACAIESCPE